jgi:hypothetical protein
MLHNIGTLPYLDTQAWHPILVSNLSSNEFGELVDFGIIEASVGYGEVWLALVFVKARNDKARLKKILYFVKIFQAELLFMTNL